MLVAIARNESALDSVEINAMNEGAPAAIAATVLKLRASRLRQDKSAYAPAVRPAKIGRNEPCLCGSGKKFKRCCG